MAVSAFKSSSRRTTTANPSTPSSSSAAAAAASSSSPRKPAAAAAAPRRSRSVSAFSRARGGGGGNAEAAASAEDFLNKRDNPLFWSNASPPDPETAVAGDSPVKRVSKPDPIGGDGGRRGRSVARSAGGVGSGGGGRKELGRSLSRVDTGRRNRSVSQCPVSRGRFVNSESEAEQEYGSVVKNRRGLNVEVDSDDQDKKGFVRNASGFDAVDQTKGLKTWSSQHSVSEPLCNSALALPCSDPTANSLFGVEEKTIKAVFEQMKSSGRGDPLEGDGHGAASGIYETVRSEVRRAISEIQNDLERAIGRSNTSAIATANITDIPPDLVNPSAVELVLDIRREYAKKLEQSQERARRLRADLAVEEHRGLELSRILKEVLPDPKTPSVQKSRPVRKASMERRKMSKRLTEEAMAYFDECVSLSTFDSSDFSSQEDPPLNIIGVTATPNVNGVLSVQAGSSASATNSNSYFKDKPDSVPQVQIETIYDPTEPTASTSYNEPHLDHFSPTSINAMRDWRTPFSFARKPTEIPNLQQGIQKYIKDSEKGIERSDTSLCFARLNNHDLSEYHLQAAAQSFVFDRVVMRNGIESGSLLLCSGGVSVSFSPFASFF